MVIDDLDIVGVALAPHEADSPLIVDPDLCPHRNPNAKQWEPRFVRLPLFHFRYAQAPRG